ncbi:MAG: choice-of-anchor T family protein [Candidatus Thalassarchaeaceae archaeon]|nr:choice-of-anchor T family protein [Candidatus Thalassarchaeaceae archaeon]
MVEPVKSVFRMTLLITIYVLSTWAGTVDNAEAQINPDISLTCSPTAIEIDVAPGDTRIGTTYCDAQNPTLYVEKVNIQITAAGLTYAAPGSITVAAGDTTTFEVVVRGEDQMAEGSRQVTISARVDQANGAPCPTCTSQTTSLVVVVKQFPMLRIQADEPFKQLRPKVDYIFEFGIYNDGNNRDQFIISVNNRDELADAGFQISLPEVNTWIESKAPPVKMRVMMRTPKKQGWSDHYYQLDFRTTSEHSIRSGGVEMSQTQMVTLYIRGVYLPGFELFPSLMMLGLAAAFVAKRRNEDHGEATADAPSPLFEPLF